MMEPVLVATLLLLIIFDVKMRQHWTCAYIGLYTYKSVNNSWDLMYKKLVNNLKIRRCF